MIIIDKAILHILDFNSGMTVYSDEELTVKDSIETFLYKHIEKSWGSQDAKPGTFYDDSAFQQKLNDYLSGEMSFVPFSKEITHTLEEAFTHAEEMASADVIVADVRIDDQRQIVVFKSNSHIGYTHQVNQTENGIKNEIINHYSIMPSLTQKMEEFAFVNTETKAVSVCAKKYTIDGNSIQVFPEILLECSLTPSPKEAIKNLSKTAAKVAEAYGQDKVATEAAVKSYVAENMQESDELDLVEAGKEIFKENPSMQADFDTAIKDAGFTEPVKMDQEATLKKMCKHKLKTDTGIELTIPTDYFDNTEFVEFNNNDDGTLSITLKHISNIINRG
ncbi:nucleoid-associated protein [Selenomonas caprae]|jgi:nucleoid-associated protein YejK|uniref:Nucleoid-associated protein n=1 Tax=Selenomonas caprae TaxID=2606905 RepID=A0A5D6WNQ6_9FIRM|nr:nucleoid-associated protein [Selenomonas caprae]MBQ1890677.1 nucleoid-associated protein [Selenomonas sp.]TYZ29553.1 nucleoid-associated protein [Selenomonas caprae]